MLVAVAKRAQSLLGCKYRFNDLETIVRDAWRWEKKFARK
jgi:UDP-glucose 4-epimerase